MAQPDEPSQRVAPAAPPPAADTAASAAASSSQGFAPAGPVGIAALPSKGSSAEATVARLHHQHTLSLSPRSNPALSDPDYYPDRDDGDDVFSNPDTAELEARSDITGATSPDRAMSPLVGSPETRGRTLAMAASHGPFSSDLDEQKRNEVLLQRFHGRGPQPAHDIVVADSSAAADGAADVSESTLNDSLTTTTPTPSTLNAPGALLGSRPASRRRAPSAGHHLHLHDAATPLPAANDLPADPSEASSVSLLFAHPPAAQADPVAHGSPAASAIRLALSGPSPTFGSPTTSRVVSAAGSPMSERTGFQWNATTPGAFAVASVSSGQASLRGATRPNSPERQRTVMPSIGLHTDVAAAPPLTGLPHSRAPTGSAASSSPSPVGGPPSRPFSGFGLGLSSPSSSLGGMTNARGSLDLAGAARTASGQGLPGAEGMSSMASSQSSIFERDIEHRDARHVLTKSEAVDVAIPPVLDDAVEALTDNSEQPLEIVSPLPSASPAPLALSAVALSAHSMVSTPVSNASPLSRSSPPMSTAGPILPAAGEVPPPGSIAAQIAERLAPSTKAAEDSAAPQSTAASLPERKARHRATHSSEASSVSSSVQSRSPANAASVQQVLDGSGTLPPLSASALASGSPQRNSAVYSRSPRDLSPAPGMMASPKQATTAPASTFGAPSTPSRPVSQHFTPASIGTALPSLPLPNPFRAESPAALRGHSPSHSMSSISDAAMPAPMSMSLDGAVIPSSESAIRELSLDGMADVIAEVDTTSGVSERRNSTSPILPRRAPSGVSPSPAHLASFGRRDTSATITLDHNEHEGLKGVNAIVESEEQMPGALPDETALAGSGKGEATNPQDGACTSPSTRRVSFFSYADIINETPAEVVDFEHSIQQAAAAEPSGTARGQTSKRASTGASMSWLAGAPSPKGSGSSRPVSILSGVGTARAGADGAADSPLLMSGQLVGSTTAAAKQ